MRTRRARSCRTSSSPRSSRCAFASWQRHAGDALDLRLLRRLRLLQLVLELLGDAPRGRRAPGPCGRARRASARSPLPSRDALLDLQHLRAAVGVLGVDVGAQLDGLLARLDLRLAAERLRLALGVVERAGGGCRRALPTLVAPNTCTASRTSAAPTAIPAATAIPMSTCDAPRSVGFAASGMRPLCGSPNVAPIPARTPRAGGRPPYVAVGLLRAASRSGVMGSHGVRAVSEKRVYAGKMW